MFRLLICLFATLVFLASSPGAAPGTVWMTPDTMYSQRDTSYVLVVYCDANLIGVKGMELDIDFNGSFVQPDTVNLLPGSIWSSLQPLFRYTYLINGNSRLTLDFAVLGDTSTVSGPGTVAIIPLNTIGFGETDITISSYRLRDNQNQAITMNTKNAWVKVCRFVGDLTADNRIDISDVTAMIDYLYISFNPPVPPLDVADINCDGTEDISDITQLIDYLFINFTPICRKCL